MNTSTPTDPRQAASEALAGLPATLMADLTALARDAAAMLRLTEHVAAEHARLRAEVRCSVPELSDEAHLDDRDAAAHTFEDGAGLSAVFEAMLTVGDLATCATGCTSTAPTMAEAKRDAQDKAVRADAASAMLTMRTEARP